MDRASRDSLYVAINLTIKSEVPGILAELEFGQLEFGQSEVPGILAKLEFGQ